MKSFFIKKTLLQILMVGFLSLSGGCSFERPKYQRDLMEVLSDKYEAEEIHMKIQNEHLIVTLVNSPLEDLSPAEKQQLANEIAVLAMAPEKRPVLESGKLVFEEKSTLGPASKSDSHSFDMELIEFH